ncbi:MAG: imidazole glycerol phosphate synthase subunit HisH [Selenomonadaceae bacterium]|nr:imidazole glycerol phosphate synthase subunit HisH [Selenomonadaceae bacterium]
MVAVVDYGVGNLFSVEKALTTLGADVRVSGEESDLRAAEKIVLPGVGAFGDCMKNLTATGLIPALKEMMAQGKPLLGICVGMQILFDGSEESSQATGLGYFAGQVKKLNAPGLKIPHMGWNSLSIRDYAPLFSGLTAQSYVYFVHSYHAVPQDSSIIAATADYGEKLTAAVVKGSVMATQFHPEKSGDVGLAILKNFLRG